ncbi:heat shock protein 70 family [Gaertneriomyces semiglobifer]|nr:heat shock protein 70 family [Gaertneriomyces semiglobifer]
MTRETENPEVFVGLSFGTLYSSVAIVGKDGRGETIANEDGERNIPSYYAFTNHGEELAGSQARVQSMSNPKGTITQFRNILGRKFEDEEVKHHIKDLPMRIVPSPNDATLPVYETESWPEDAEEAVLQHHTAQEVTAKYIQKLKETAENYLGTQVSGCVISVPVSFEKEQCQALLRATKDAGFTKTYTVCEPVAAALAFEGAQKGDAIIKKDKLVLVLDLGGHQFNLTLLSANNGLYTVVTSLDDERLGGVHFDELLMDFVAQDFKRKTKMDIGNNRRAKTKLQKACEQTKRALSRQDNAPCSVESLYEGMDYHGAIPRARFEMLAEPLYVRCAGLIRKALSDADVKIEDVDEVLLVGGASRMPRFQAVTRGLFPSASIRSDVEPDEAVSMGCAVQAGIILSAPSNLNYATASQNTEVIDAPHLAKSVGIALGDGSYKAILPRRAPVPSRRTISFPLEKQQKEVYFAVYEGDAPVAQENKLLAEVVLGEIEENEGNQVHFTLTIEKDGVLTAYAKEEKTNKSVKVKVAELK